MRKVYILEYVDEKYYFGLTDNLNEIIITLHATQIVVTGTVACAYFFSNLLSYAAAPEMQINFHPVMCKIFTLDRHTENLLYTVLRFKNSLDFLDVYNLRLPYAVIARWLQLIFRGAA